MAQRSSYTGKELRWMKWFRYVIVSSKFQQLNNLLIIRLTPLNTNNGISRDWLLI